jgi:chromosome segregation ATPase
LFVFLKKKKNSNQGYASWSSRENVAGSVVGGLLGSDELRRFRSLYEEGRESRPLSEAQLALRLHQTKSAALEARLAEAKAQLAKLMSDYQNGSARMLAMNKALDEKRAENDRVAAEIARFHQLMAESEFAGTVKELQSLVALNETLKTHMEQFEASCKRQAEELRAKVLALRGSDEEDGETQFSCLRFGVFLVFGFHLLGL